MKLIGALIALPAIALIAFMLLYSIDAGCFICLYGDESGGTVEVALNVSIALALLLGILFWLRKIWTR